MTAFYLTGRNGPSSSVIRTDISERIVFQYKYNTYLTQCISHLQNYKELSISTLFLKSESFRID